MTDDALRKAVRKAVLDVLPEHRDYAIAIAARVIETLGAAKIRCRCQFEAGDDSDCPKHPPDQEEQAYAAAIGAPYAVTKLRLPAGAMEWLRSGERGLSSKSIFAYLTGMPIMDGWPMRTPADPADLRRCRLLIEAVPDLRAGLPHMAEVSPQWSALVARWDELCAVMDAEAPDWRERPWVAPMTDALMQEIERGERP